MAHIAPRRGRGARTILIAALAAAAVLAGCTAPTEPPPSTPPARPPTAAPPPTPAPEPPALAQSGVSAGHPAAAEAGAAILREGGNAVDAAIAAAFAVAVVEPFTSGLGGGGGALVVPSDPDAGPARAYDYREVVANDGAIPASSTGIPGFVAGMTTMHEEHGSLDWAELVEPAIALARDGHPVSAMTAAQLRGGAGAAATSGQGHFFADGRALAEGEMLVQAELASTMELIAAEGTDGFYAGPLAEQLSALPGIDGASLADYEVQIADPVSGAVGDYEVLGPPPALTGVALIQLLQIAEAAGVGDSDPGSAGFLDALANGWRTADATVFTLLGDPAFVDVPIAELTDPAANSALASAAAPGDAGLASVAAHPLEAGNTTHVSVVDEDGLAVSMTNTIMSFWGSGDYVAGFFLNDHLLRFGIGSNQSNAPSPGRRPVTYSTPTIVADAQGRPVLVLGSPGGRQIPNILAGVISRWALHGESLDEAVAAGRAHLEGGVLRVEQLPSPEDEALLRALGYGFEVVSPAAHLFGSVQALEIDHEERRVIGTADTRREAGFVIIDGE